MRKPNSGDSEIFGFLINEFKVRCSVAWPSTSRSADPNDFYRAWLEKNVGKYGIDWGWTVGANDNLHIFFKDSKKATLFLLVKDSLLK